MFEWKEVLRLAAKKGYTPFLNRSQWIELLKADIFTTYHLVEFTCIQAWLRNIEYLAISIKFDSYKPDKPVWYFTINSLSSKDMGEKYAQGITQCDTYEQALAEGIYEALKIKPS